MSNQTNYNHDALKVHFAKGFSWNLWGSIVYEATKTLHLFFLMQCCSSAGYGVISSIFSIAYFATYLIDLGAYTTLPPFIAIWTQSKSSFRSCVINYYLIPFSIGFIITIGGLILLLNRHIITAATTGLFIIVPIIIFFESFRTFFRLMLHLLFQSKYIVIFETSFLLLYFSSIWIAYLFFSQPISPYIVFIPHCIDSIAGVLFCSWLLYRYYQQLPDKSNAYPQGLSKRIFATRGFNYLLRLSRHMFTNGFLTPFFAIRFGFKSAGLFYFASTCASSLQSIIKAIMVYSGNAFLANVKDSSLEVKKEAFNILSQKLTAVVVPIIIFLVINYNTILRLTQTHNPTYFTLALAALFFMITTTEFYLILYEQFYIIEEASKNIFLFKVIEMILFYMVIKYLSGSIVSTLLGVVIIRLVSFCIIAVNAFFTWRIKPNLKINPKLITASIILAGIVGYLIP